MKLQVCLIATVVAIVVTSVAVAAKPANIGVCFEGIDTDRCSDCYREFTDRESHGLLHGLTGPGMFVL
jgi:hypothetical protein